jgi:hypothetical protein
MLPLSRRVKRRGGFVNGIVSNAAAQSIFART